MNNKVKLTNAEFKIFHSNLTKYYMINIKLKKALEMVIINQNENPKKHFWNGNHKSLSKTL